MSLKLQMPLAVLFLLPFLAAAGPAATDDKASLQGVWNAKSMDVDGKPGPVEAVKRMRFTFKDDKLLVRGNHNDDSEQECRYEIDATKSPKHFDFTQADKQHVSGIYEINGDELRVCLRHASSSDGRPADFSTKPQSKLILLVFKRADAKPISPPDAAKPASLADAAKPVKPADAAKPISPAEAAKKVGEVVTLRMKVESATLRGENCFLNSEKDFKNLKNFTVFLDKAAVEKFQKTKIDDPAEHFKGKTIEVHGKIELYHDRPEIKLAGPEQVKIVDVK
jgi:uncharacterized protein (TIGR03067 family)